jgi:hypothetical protein
MLPIYFDVHTEGSSVKPFVHYGQSINNTGYFRKYDMGSEQKNIDEYGTPEPPDYNLANIQLVAGSVLPLSRKKSDMNFEILKQAQIWSNISNLGTKRKEIHSSFH